jgi:hypothetical protein
MLDSFFGFLVLASVLNRKHGFAIWGNAFGGGVYNATRKRDGNAHYT